MNRWLLYLSFITISSCTGGKKEVMDINELLPQAKNDPIVNIPIDSVEREELILGFDTLDLQNSGLSFDFNPVDTLLFPHRFDPIETHSFQFELNNQTGFYSYWKYKSQNSAKSAFMNWLNCYSPKCLSINLYDSVSMQAKPFIIALTDSTIYYWDNVKQKDQENIIKSLSYNTLKEVSYLLKQGPRKIVEWRLITNGKEEEFIKN